MGLEQIAFEWHLPNKNFLLSITIRDRIFQCLVKVMAYVRARVYPSMCLRVCVVGFLLRRLHLLYNKVLLFSSASKRGVLVNSHMRYLL